MPVKPISVSQLNTYIKRIIATDPMLTNVVVTGEISSLVHHGSGHIYFTLKDDNSRLRCFFSAEKAAALRFILSEGMQIIVYGNVSVFEKGGTYSLNIQDIDLSGEGALNVAFENLKKKLLKEGLFDDSNKKALPVFPKRIAVITSPTGAAVRDIVSTIKQKNPLTDVIIYPCLVQGEGAARSIANAVLDVNQTLPDIDLIILGRGGGALEDLWAFNEEIVAKAVFDSYIPVISAVGHETDTVITDYVADARAATPTAAAQIAVLDITEIKNKLSRLDPLKLNSVLKQKIEALLDKCSYLKHTADSVMIFRYHDCRNKLELCALEFELSNPLNMLNKGYAIVSDSKNQRLVSSEAIRVKDKLKIVMKDGTIHCTVESVEENVWLKKNQS